MSLPKETIEKINERSGGVCEVPGCTLRDFRGLQLCHITHRKMGGRNGDMAKIINDPRNIALLCAEHHDILDNRVKASKLRDWLTMYLKKKLDWEGWKQEFL